MHTKVSNGILFISQVVRILDTADEEWEIPRSEIEVGEKLGQGNYGSVFKGQLTVTAMSPTIHAHKKEMDFEGKSHLQVALKMLRGKWIHLRSFIHDAFCSYVKGVFFANCY